MQKRNFFRLNYQKDFDFALLNPETIQVISNPYKGTLKDISGGGLSFTSSEVLEKGQMMEIKITNDNKLLLLIGKVVRSDLIDELPYYAVEFVHVDKKTQDEIIQLIFNIQRKSKLNSNFK